MIKLSPHRTGKLDEYSNEFLLEVYAKGPARLRSAIAGLSEEELSVFPFADKWSIKEIAFHLTESELFGTIRFRQALAKNGLSFPYYDQDLWTRNLKYQQRGLYELEDSLHLFSLLRKINYRLLESLQGDEWQRSGIHPERGVMTLRQLLELYADHSERHIDQILARRRLFGNPVEIPVILPKRL